MLGTKALKAAKQGAKIAHLTFASNEFITYDTSRKIFVDQDGISIIYTRFTKKSYQWADGWKEIK